VGNDTIGIDTANYLPSIEESCPYPVTIFSDSMLNAWNQASILNITRENSRYLDDCLKTYVQIYQQSDNFRLEFCKRVLNNDYLRDSDFDTGFYIIEEVHSGAYISTKYYLIVTRKNDLISYVFAFTPFYKSFYLRGIETLNKARFRNFYESFIKQDNNDGMGMPYRKFNVTYFYRKKIDSYISGCTGCLPCIDEFKKLAENSLF
jgi:hypothetical protein